MKQKGFTLIELLAVIVILSVIALITIISISSTINDSKKSLSSIQVKNVESAAKAYYLKEGMNTNDSCISVSELISKGYIEGNSVIDPETKEELDGSVKITYNSNQYYYDYQEEICKVCTIADTDGDDVADVGEVVTCPLIDGDENFYVIEETSLKEENGMLKMLTEKNVNTTTYRQSDDAGKTKFSSSDYWLDDTGNLLPEFGNGYPAYIYNEKSDIIYEIVESYVDYLKDNSFSPLYGNLLSYDQIYSLGCNFENYKCSGKYSWIYSTSYWLGIPGNQESKYMIWIVYEDNNLATESFAIPDVGVRPVITIPKTLIKY